MIAQLMLFSVPCAGCAQAFAGPALMRGELIFCPTCVVEGIRRSVPNPLRIEIDAALRWWLDAEAANPRVASNLWSNHD